MVYRVNENCIGCGMCESLCPEVFYINNENVAESKSFVPDGCADAAEDARKSCPVDAIEKE